MDEETDYKEINYGELAKKLDEAAEIQWLKTGNMYSVSGETVKLLPPGYYKVIMFRDGIRFIKKDVDFNGILSLNSANMNEILNDIKKFWTKRETFDKYKLPYKRGILLSGSPGTGKTSLIKLIAQEVINLNGICLEYDLEEELIEGLSSLSEIQPSTPIVVVIEDIDLRRVSSDLLNILDGVVKLRNVIFIATTNYPENIDNALINRPGRIDAHYKIGEPSEKVRRQYIKTILEVDELNKIDIEMYVKDSEGLPIGHIKELVVSTVILEKDYGQTLEMLRNMQEGREDEDVEKEGDDEFENY